MPRPVLSQRVIQQCMDIFKDEPTEWAFPEKPYKTQPGRTWRRCRGCGRSGLRSDNSSGFCSKTPECRYAARRAKLDGVA